jgi:GntR family transcriptional regulator
MDAPYQHVLRDIRRRIATGEWPPGTRIPSRRSLTELYGVGPGAVHHAIDVLRASGELEGQKRYRAWVADPPAVRTMLDPDAEWPYGRGDPEPGRIRADQDLAARLQVEPGTWLTQKRIDLLDPGGRVSHLETRWWPEGAQRPWVRSAWEAQLHAMTPEEGQALGLVAGVRALLVIRTRYGESGRPVETADLVLPGDRWRIGSRG